MRHEELRDKWLMEAREFEKEATHSTHDKASQLKAKAATRRRWAEEKYGALHEKLRADVSYCLAIGHSEVQVRNLLGVTQAFIDEVRKGL